MLLTLYRELRQSNNISRLFVCHLPASIPLSVNQFCYTFVGALSTISFR
jgi:hypothetical protein